MRECSRSTTARLNGVEPCAYLCDVLARINRHRLDRLAELLQVCVRAGRRIGTTLSASGQTLSARV